MSDLLFIQPAYQKPTAKERGAAKIALAMLVLGRRRSEHITLMPQK